MEILKSEQYISEKLNIKPVSKERLADYSKEPIVDETIAKFIEENELKWNPSTRSYDCVGDIAVNENIVSKGKITIKFGHVIGSFNCGSLHLTTLDGAPQEVGGDFYCFDNKLITLEGAPQKVGGCFDCRYNNLTTLKGAPQKVGDSFDCSHNELTNLEGAPQEVGGYFECSNNKLTTLEGAPQKVGDYFDCRYNPNLVLPKEKPSWLKGEFITK